MKWIYNPFEQLAGWRAFFIGLMILCIATVIGYFGNTVFYGISIKAVPSVTWGKTIFLQSMGLGVTVLAMWITALLSAKHVRFQDILGTVTLAKYPLILAAIMFLALSKRLNEISDMFMSAGSIQNMIEIAQSLRISDYILFMVMAIISILILVWTIALLFNAFRVSTNLKGSKCTALFIVALLISEIIIQVIISIVKHKF